MFWSHGDFENDVFMSHSQSRNDTKREIHSTVHCSITGLNIWVSSTEVQSLNLRRSNSTFDVGYDTINKVRGIAILQKHQIN